MLQKLITILLLTVISSTSIPTALAQSRLEAESAAYSNCQLITDAKYSGRKALELTEQNARIAFTYTTENAGKYTIYVGCDGLYGDKIANLTVNGSGGTFTVKGSGEVEAGVFFIKKGSNTIVITPNWTWFRIDYIRIEPHKSELKFDISQQPVDAEATTSARALYRFLYDNFGKKTISGIMTGDMSGVVGSNVKTHPDMKAVYAASGKFPALVGFDFMNTTGRDEAEAWNRSYSTAVVNLAKDTWRRGGIPAFTWHWRDPSRATDAFYTDGSTMKITSAMNPDGTWNTSSTLYANILKDINTVADILLDLQKQGAACIFRPLHESSGGWFWWGREGAQPFIKLYHLIYDQMVNVRGVHNVIWVWNAGDRDHDWDPGTEYYDIVSADIYNSAYDYSSCYATFDNLKKLTGGKKIIALSENGPIPDIDREVEEEAVWSWWMPWYQTWNGRFVDKTSKEEWKKCMDDDRVITLEDMSGAWSGTSAIVQPTMPSAQSLQPLYYDADGRLATSADRKHVVYIWNQKKFIAVR